jgi:protein-L-isoaspartate(D-aspartate) O-methyltransferase
MARVPMHSFAYKSEQIFAYVGNLFLIGKGETISAPHMLSIMFNLLDLQPGQQVLEIGGRLRISCCCHGRTGLSGRICICN